MITTTIEMKVTKRLWFWTLVAILSPMLILSKSPEKFYGLIAAHGIKIEVI